jgi:flagellar hook-associated protein 1 FlgK
VTLSTAFNIINSAFTTIGTQSSTIASNVANANTPGYSREIANQVTDIYGGSKIDSITRVADDALLGQVNASTSESAMQSAIASGLTTLAKTVSDSSTSTSSTGSLVNGNSPSAMLANLDDALVAYEDAPTSTPLAQAAVTAAENLTASLNAGANAVTQVRTQADQGIAQAVSTVNSLLGQFQTVNNQIVGGLAVGGNVGSEQDQRDSILTQISQQIGIVTSTNPDGSMSIFTDSGVPLFEVAPFNLSFQTSGQLGASVQGAQVMVDGMPITGSNSAMPIQSGAIAGLVQLRDQIAPQYGAQLDQIAGNLISAFSETDQSTTNTGLPAEPGLFTYAGASGVPAASDYTGLAASIEVNPNVDPSQGGDASLIRDGGISDPSSGNYTYNTTGGSGYSGRIQQLVAALQTPMSFSASGGIGTSATLTNYASESVGWLQGQNSQASSNAAYQSSLLSQASAALQNANGVNLDAELTNMLNIENAYTTSAKLLTTVTSLLQTLMNAA